eukprot:PITA_29178
MSHPDFHDLISTEWKSFSSPPDSKMFQFQQKLKHLKSKIKHWNHTSFGNNFKAQPTLELEMKQLQQRIITDGRSDDLSEQENALEAQLTERAKQEETLWRQKSRGIKVETREEIESALLNYFKQMHREPNVDRSQAIEKITRNIPKLISEEHNQLLLKPVDLQEVELAAQQLKAGKAPGPDGFTSNFFHNFWDLIKMEVW